MTDNNDAAMAGEIRKRLYGAAVVAGWREGPDWQKAIDYLRERAQQAAKCEDALRSLAAYVGAGGYNAESVDAKVFEEKVTWGIDHIVRVESGRSKPHA